MAVLWVAAVLYFSGYYRPADHYPGILVIDLIKDNGRCETQWKAEIERRFPTAIMVFVHGNDMGDTWVIIPQDGSPVRPVADLCRELRSEFPKRPIVLICCNPGHHHLKMPGVYHPLDLVWMSPDKAGNMGVVVPEYVGNIFEFVDQ